MPNPIDLFEDDNTIIPGAEDASDIKYKPSSETIKEEKAKTQPEATPEPADEPTNKEGEGFGEKVSGAFENVKEKFVDFATDQVPFVKQIKDVNNVNSIIGQNISGKERSDRSSQEADAAMTLGGIDFAMDVAGNVPLLSPIDDAWDEKTKFSNPLAREVRSISSVILPSVVGGGPVAGAMSKLGGSNALARGVMGITGRAGVDVSVAALSDYSERDEGVMNGLDSLLDKMGNPLGMNIPEAAKVQDGDSMQTRHFKLMTEAAGFSVMGDVLGYLLNRGKKTLQWFEPKSEDAKEFADWVKLENPDIETVDMISQYRQMAEEATDSKAKTAYNNFADQLEVQMKEDGFSEATSDPMESYVKKQQTTRDLQNDEVAAVHIQQSMAEGATPETIPFKPEVHREIVEEADTFKESIPKANVARNAADIAAMADGKTTRTTVPAPVVTDAMLTKGLQLDIPSRVTIAEVAEETRRTGKFDAVIEDARYTQKQMDDAAWNIEAQALRAKDVDGVRELFMSRKDVKNLRNMTIEYMNNEQLAQAGRTLRLLTDQFLDPDTVLTSARARETLGREASAIAEAMTTFKGAVNEEKIQQVIMDKMAFLFEEQGIAKYVAGWSLQNVAWWKRLYKSDKKLQVELLEGMEANFSEAMRLNHERSRKLVQAYQDLRATDPEKARLLASGVDASDGELDTIDKINAWANSQTNPGGLLVDATGKGGNLFGQTIKAIWYNNILSGLSASKAAIGGFTQHALQPLEYMIGAGIEDLMTGGKYQMIKSGFYAHSSILAANKQALKDSWGKFMKASKDPQSVEAAIRQDYRMRNDQMFELLEQTIDTSKDLNVMGRWTLLNKSVADNPILKWGTNAMVGIDQYSATLNATASSRYRAYWDAMENGDMNPANMLKAEGEHYRNIFGDNNVINDNWVKETTSSIALNQDNVIGDGIAALTGYIPGLTPFTAFPRTSTNWIRRSMEYTPIANLIPPKIRKTLLAKDSNDIVEAMALHGIDPTDPHIERIWRNQKAIYMGRVVFGAGTVMGLMNYALQGNIRGNWPRNSAQKKAWQEAGIKPKTIDIGGTQVSYDGMLPFDPLLTIIGDMSTYANDIDSAFMTDIRDKLIWTLANSYVNDTPLGGLEPLVALAGGDDSAATRFFATQARSGIPMSGAMGVVANATNSAQKDIYNDFLGYIQNRIPVLNDQLPDMIDPWTATKFNDITNPYLRLINASSPIKFYPGPEPWRKKLVSIGMPGLGILKKDSTGTFEYPPEMRRVINELIGNQEPWRKAEKALNNPKYTDQMDEVRKIRRSGLDSEKIKIDTEKLPLIKKLNSIMREAQERAEQQMLADPQYAHFKETRIGQKLVNKYLSTGQVPEAFAIQQRTVKELDELKQLGVGN